jgi:hypothetical protein
MLDAYDLQIEPRGYKQLRSLINNEIEVVIESLNEEKVFTRWMYS